MNDMTKNIYETNAYNVYVNGRLVGAALTQESESAIRRLMAIPVKQEKK